MKCFKYCKNENSRPWCTWNNVQNVNICTCYLCPKIETETNRPRTVDSQPVKTDQPPQYNDLTPEPTEMQNGKNNLKLFLSTEIVNLKAIFGGFIKC